MSDPSKWSSAHAAYNRYLDETAGIALRTGPDLYPGINLAVSSLEWLAAESFVILGFDGFTTDGNWLYPSLEYIADFSDLVGRCSHWEEAVRRSNDEARRVLERWSGAVQFVDVVVSGRDEDTDSD